MRITLKHHADYFVIALEIGLAIKEEIIIWADNLILKYSEPSMWMIDLSTSQNQNIQDTIDILNEVESDHDLNISCRLVVTKLGKLYPSIKDANYQILSSLAYSI